jgi:hypothetical protein
MTIVQEMIYPPVAKMSMEVRICCCHQNFIDGFAKSVVYIGGMPRQIIVLCSSFLIVDAIGRHVSYNMIVLFSSFLIDPDFLYI